MQRLELELSLSTKQIKQVLRRYHFKDTDFSLLEQIYNGMLPLLRAKAFAVWKWNKQLPQIDMEEFCTVFLTLGSAIDSYQDLYAQNVGVAEAYMIDCLAAELLQVAYEKTVEQIEKRSKRWVGKIIFLGEKYPMDLVPVLAGEMGEMEISYNECFVLSPRKSVVFLLPFSETKQEDNCHICTQCKNLTCSQRKREGEVLPYGYEKILGGRKPT